MDDHVVADIAAEDAHMGAHRAIASDLDMRTNDGAGQNTRARADCSLFADNGIGLDRDALFKLRIRMNNGERANTCSADTLRWSHG